MPHHRLAWLCLVLGHAVLAFYFVDARFTANPLSRALTVVSIYEEGTLRIDRYHALTPDKARIDGHYVSDKPPLATAITAVAFGATRPFAHRPVNPRYRAHRDTRRATVLGGLLAGSLPFLAILLLSVDAARQLPLAGRAWLVPLAVYGGFLHIYAGVFMGHLLGAALLVLAYRSLFERDRPARAGLLLGAAFLAEYPLALALPLWAAQRSLRERSAREAIALAVGFAPGLALAAGYNALTTGDPFTFAYKLNATAEFAALGRAYGLARPSLETIYGLTFSPFRGVFFYAPAALVLLASILVAGRREGARALLGDGALGFFLVSLLFYVSRADDPWPVWTGGTCYGPRYLVPATALLVYRGVQTIGPDDRLRTVLVGATGALGVALAWSASVTTSYLAGSDVEPNPVFDRILPALFREGPDARWSLLAQYARVPVEIANLLWLAVFGATLAVPARLFRRGEAARGRAAPAPP
jgi:hypothetical protein